MMCTMMGVLVITGAWAKVFGGPGDDFAYSVAIGATDGNPVIAGYTTSYGNNGEALLMRLSLNTGDFMGAITYGEASYLQEARSIIATPDGGFVITGKWERFLWLFRVNYTGGIIWSRGIASLAGGAGGYAVARTSGYFLSVGYLADDIFAFLWNGSSGDAGYYTNQAEDGEQGPLEIKALAAATAPDSGVIVAGWRYQDYYYHNTNAYVFKTNPGSLTRQWDRDIGDDYHDEEAYSVCVWPNGSSAIAGRRDGDILVVNLASNGSVSWVKRYDAGTSEAAYSIITTSDGGYAIAGVRAGDILVAKLASDGQVVWARTIGTSGVDVATSLAQAPDGSLIVVGYTNGIGSGGYDILAINLPPNGEYQGCLSSVSLNISGTSLGSMSGYGALGPFACYLYGGDLTPSTVGVNPAILNICQPLYEENEEKGWIPSEPRITCCSAPGALIFYSDIETEIRIYGSDGRVVYRGDIGEGNNRISIEAGVYLWQAGPYKGKAVVR